MPKLGEIRGPFTTMFTRGGPGVCGQKKTNLVNVVCERPLIDFSYYEILGPDICSLICGSHSMYLDSCPTRTKKLQYHILQATILRLPCNVGADLSEQNQSTACASVEN